MTEVRIHRQGRAGRITLARPHALNALSQGMVRSILDALLHWRIDPEVDVVLIDAEGERAFCAGGDVRAIWTAAQTGNPGFARRFWRDEYALNALIAEYPKPVVAFLHGLVMGGGVGLGCHASYRIVGHTSRISMPECAIGLVPDVGGSLLLACSPGRLGEYLGLTGAHLDGPGAVFAGLADAFVREERWDDLKAEICRTGHAVCIADHAEAQASWTLPVDLKDIDHIFSGETLPDIRDLSNDLPGVAAALEAASPLSLAVTLQLVRGARSLDRVCEAVAREFAVTARSIEHMDFLEGVRAKVIDKDGRPRWRHRRIEDVSAEDVACLLAPLPDAPAFCEGCDRPEETTA